MINLLPSDYKQNIIYARRNWILRRWILSLSVALILGLGIIAGGYVYLDYSVKQESKGIEAAKAKLQEENIDETRKKLDEISNNTKLILQVLSKEVLFSKLMRQLGASLPANTALEGIDIDSLNGSITLRASAKDVDSATQIQVNLADPNNQIFEKADIENINCGANNQEQQEETSLYPCSVQLKALFAKNNPYTYIQTLPASQEKKP